MTHSNDKSDNPEALLTSIRAGYRDAVGRLLEIYRNYLGLLARLGIGWRLRGKVDEGDIVQDVFLKAHRELPDFRGQTEAELTMWLRQVLAGTLANVIRQYVGTGKRDVNLERSLADDLDRSSRSLNLAAPGTSPSDRAVRREQAVLLANALNTLPSDHREVIVLRNFEELPFVEVSVRMGRSEEAVKKLWARALKGLQRVLVGGANGHE